MSKEQEGHHGWAPDVGKGGSERATEANKKAFGTPSKETGEGRVVSDEERAGVLTWLKLVRTAVVDAGEGIAEVVG